MTLRNKGDRSIFGVDFIKKVRKQQPYLPKRSIKGKTDTPEPMKTTATILTIFLLAACSESQRVYAIEPEDSLDTAERRSLMIGTWFGDTETKDGGRIMHIVDRYIDGTMRIRFKVLKTDGSVFEQQEISIWGISGLIYFTATRGFVENGKVRQADTSKTYFYDAYEILDISEDTFHYRHVDNGNEYKIEKVAPSFDFPI